MHPAFQAVARATALALLGTMTSHPAAAQRLAGADAVQPHAADTAQAAEVMILGMFHFDDPGLDVVQSVAIDVLEPTRQAEILKVVDALAVFRPTKVAVEARLESGARLDSLYNAFLAGEHALSRNEIEQLGFRLAARFDLPGVDPIDHPGEFPFEQLMDYAGRHDPAAVRMIQDMIAAVTEEENRRKRELTIGGNLRVRNDPARLAEEHGFYVRLGRVGAGDTYVGADLLASWYERNVRIFSHIQRITRPGGRVLVIVGSGHAPILRELVGYDPGMTLVEPADYLP